VAVSSASETPPARWLSVEGRRVRGKDYRPALSGLRNRGARLLITCDFVAWPSFGEATEAAESNCRVGEQCAGNLRHAVGALAPFREGIRPKAVVGYLVVAISRQPQAASDVRD
jgi:hypothetical protein